MKTIRNQKTKLVTGILAFMAISGFAQISNQNIKNEIIKPFHASVSNDALKDLRQRISMTRWPSKETVTDQSQGVKLDQIQRIVKYWGTDYDWHKAEAKLNSFPQFTTNIDGLDIHFIHVRSKHKNAMPLIITHGWPGSIFEVLKAIDPLTNPTKYGGKAEDAFDVVIPSMPGYGFSGKPTEAGWGVEKMGQAWDVLMKRLGYHHYVSQGGDWGAVVADAMGRQAPEGLLGIHVNMPATVPAEVADILKSGGSAPENLTEKEKAAFNSLNKLYTKGGGYAGMMVTRPQTLGYGLTDSPVALASFFLDKFNDWTYSGGNAEKSLTKDEMLDDITLYWLTNTANSSAQLYWENNNNNFNVVEQRTQEIKVPVAITVFPGEIYQAPKSWAEKAYPTLQYFNEVKKGGHFASWEEPQLFAEELRAAFRSLRK
ncbi:pimeloyl-ACP methyl ester carboxylesterase [Chryseobacterium ginsenosidimutans]|uniref:epoxide hydrolase family protein n=1 Tax=Chryseobacterium ginsenosidimutans TaxID=687846 RepID=UPI002168F152|nr:epoxide hydrolase family protein [Chryseobacterium ginsenosidimutans]MCS3869618.1 pimeloyl-ACP methyl ester carboxylesterase [Chryseobacterium ginsenosidimutans]